jgi:hypothetical protein
MRAYKPMNYNVVALIHQDSTYKKMTSDDILGRIINHEMSQLQRSKKLLSKLARRARTSK